MRLAATCEVARVCRRQQLGDGHELLPVGDGGWEMINQDEVFVITEDDILKPSDKGKGKGGGPRAVPATKAAKAAERQAEVEETVAERPTSARGRRRRSPAAAS